MKWKTRPLQKVKNGGKAVVARVVFWALGRAFRVLYRCDGRVRQEVESWEMGYCICMHASPGGPSLFLQRSPNGIKRLRRMPEQEPDITIAFKSIDAAFLVLTGQIGVAQAYAQHRFTLRGNIGAAMSFVRCVDIAEGYLFPQCMTKRFLKETPRREIPMLWAYCRVLAGR